MPMRGGQYTITKSAPTGYTPLGVIRKAAYEEMNEFAESKNKVAQVVSSNEVPAGFARWPQVEIRFKLLEEGELESQSSPTSQRLSSTVFDASGRAIDTETTVYETQKADIYEELKKLGELRDKGVLTDTEFDREKQKLLNK